VHRGMDHVGAFLGPVVAYLMLCQGLGVRAVFACTAVTGALCIAVLAVFVKDAVRAPSSEAASLASPPLPHIGAFFSRL
jgi:hypothetical protein